MLGPLSTIVTVSGKKVGVSVNSYTLHTETHLYGGRTTTCTVSLSCPCNCMWLDHSTIVKDLSLITSLRDCIERLQAPIQTYLSTTTAKAGRDTALVLTFSEASLRCV